MDKNRIIKKVFEIAMHSIRNEEIFLHQEAMKRYYEEIAKPRDLSVAVLSYEEEIKRATLSIEQRRKWLYELMDEFYKGE